MHRDQCEVAASNVDWHEQGGPPAKPLLAIAYHGRHAELAPRLTTPTGEDIATTALDVAFRFQSPATGPDAPGVVSVADRTTGAFVLEAQTSAAPVLDLVAAGRSYNAREGDSQYALLITTDRGTPVSTDQRLLRVYASDGTLLRDRSLIPADVEL